LGLKVCKSGKEKYVFYFELILRYRLCLKKINGQLVLDDSFNSNIKGFRNALEVLGMYSMYRVLITPGIVEGGKKEEIINYELNNDIAKNCDFVILVKNKVSEYIKKGLDDIQYNSYIEVESYIEGFNKYQEINNEKIVLIENDISDLYKI
jgi:UDP-N-acetylmuramyl pentapeptide synthase